MKKSAVGLFVVIFFLQPIAFNMLNAAAVYENVNQSAEFVRTLNRNASTEVDAAFFNPAGLAFMQGNGLFLYFSDQFIRQSSTVEDSTGSIETYMGNGKSHSFDGTATAYVYPTLHLAYKKDNIAYFFSLMPLGGGSYGSCDVGLPGIHRMAIGYARGVVSGGGDTLISYKADATVRGAQFTIAPTTGVSYAFNNKISVGIGLRYLYYYEFTDMKLIYKNITGTFPVDYMNIADFSPIKISSSADGSAFGFIGALHYIPAEQLHIGIRFEYYTPLKVKQDVTKLEGPAGLQSTLNRAFPDGETTKKTYPMVLSTGFSYMIFSKLKVEPGLTYFFNKQADWDGQEKNFKNGYDIGAALEYEVLENMKTSIGYSYSVSGRTTKSRNETTFGLDYNSVGLGATYTFSETWSLTFAGLCVFSKSETIPVDDSMNPGTQKLSDFTWDIAIGITYKVI